MGSILRGITQRYTNRHCEKWPRQQFGWYMPKHLHKRLKIAATHAEVDMGSIVEEALERILPDLEEQLPTL